MVQVEAKQVRVSYSNIICNPCVIISYSNIPSCHNVWRQCHRMFSYIHILLVFTVLYADTSFTMTAVVMGIIKVKKLCNCSVIVISVVIARLWVQ